MDSPGFQDNPDYFTGETDAFPDPSEEDFYSRELLNDLCSEDFHSPANETDTSFDSLMQPDQGGRKRSFGTHLGHDSPDYGKESKSARTTPPETQTFGFDDFASSPPAQPPTSPDVIDLTGDDDTVDNLLEQQRRQTQQFRPKQEPGQHLTAHSGRYGSASGSHGIPPAGQSFSVPSGRPHPIHPGVGPFALAPTSTQQPSYRGTINNILNPATNSLNRSSAVSQFGRPSQSMTVAGPSHPFPSFMSASSLLQTTGSGGDYGSSMMPGTFVDSSESEDSDAEFRRMNNLPPRPAGNPYHQTVPDWRGMPTLPTLPQSLSSNNGLQLLSNGWPSGSVPSLPGQLALAGGLAPAMTAMCTSLKTEPGFRSLYGYDGYNSDDADPYGRGGQKTEERIKKLLENIRPDSDVPAEKCEETPKELQIKLMPHQKLGLKWMKEQEDGVNNGGILADEMGLGKTVTTLSLVVARPAPHGEVKTNLIIGPVSLLKQWQEEISVKVKDRYRLKVLLLHNKKGVTIENLRQYDVVLTTYGTVASEVKRMKQYKANFADSPDHDFNADQTLKKMCPLLHSNSIFYRIILDEAQYIKNHKTQTAQAAVRLKAKYRWCLTGTPMMNGAHELYPLLEFVRVEPYTSLKVFNQHFAALTAHASSRQRGGYSQNQAMDQLQVVLKATMLRRTKTSKIDGKPILELPPKSEETATVGFSEAERDFYTSLETQSRNQFNVYQRQGTISKNYSVILVLLLRLRQACCHPHLNMDLEFVEVDEGKVDAVKKLSADAVSRIQAAMSFVCPGCQEPVADPQIIIQCGHSICRECLAIQAQDFILQAGDDAQARCPTPACSTTFSPDSVINCATFKSVHGSGGENRGIGLGASNGEAGTPGEPGSPVDSSSDTVEDDGPEWSDLESDSDDGTDVDDDGNLAGFVVDDDETEEDGDSSSGEEEVRGKASSATTPSAGEKPPKFVNPDGHGDSDGDFRPTHKASRKAAPKGDKGKSKAKPAIKIKKKREVTASMLADLRKKASRSKADRAKYMKYLSDNWVTSTKVDTCCKLLLDIQKTGEKTLVFSVWTVLLDLLEVAIRKQLRLKVVRYDGSMSMEQRATAVRKLRDDPDLTIMLLSLRAGNAGLNLTSASNVIIMDPFWNPYVEMQAVDRAHRIGQERPVRIHRVLVQETIEDRIVKLQETKRELVEAALDETKSKALGRLSHKDLGFLFNGRNPTT